MATLMHGLIPLTALIASHNIIAMCVFTAVFAMYIYHGYVDISSCYIMTNLIAILQCCHDSEKSANFDVSSSHTLLSLNCNTHTVVKLYQQLQIIKISIESIQYVFSFIYVRR